MRRVIAEEVEMENGNTTVRMVLYGYVYTDVSITTVLQVVLDMEFSSVESAFRFREEHLEITTSGYISGPDGVIIQEIDDGYDWSEHETKCDGCPTCNPTAFRDED